MEIEKYLKTYANPETHASISKLTENEMFRVKNFIEEIVSQTKREFEISEIAVFSDKIELKVN